MPKLLRLSVSWTKQLGLAVSSLSNFGILQGLGQSQYL
jgi:hypothetical protein